jgi:hypothetical protein
MMLLLWGRVAYLALLCALVAMYLWVTYQTRHE